MWRKNVKCFVGVEAKTHEMFPALKFEGFVRFFIVAVEAAKSVTKGRITTIQGKNEEARPFQFG